jgi:hypothetical protein
MIEGKATGAVLKFQFHTQPLGTTDAPSRLNVEDREGRTSKEYIAEKEMVCLQQPSF